MVKCTRNVLEDSYHIVKSAGWAPDGKILETLLPYISDFSLDWCIRQMHLFWLDDLLKDAPIVRSAW